MRFLCELSPYTAMYELDWPAISLLGGELALPISGWPASAALIGNSDTTAKPPSWQVYFRCTLRGSFAAKRIQQALEPHLEERSESTKRCSKRSSVSVLHWHWPPEACGRRLSAAPSAGCPAGLPFVGSARLAVALAGACCSWLTEIRQPVHHWHLTR